MSSLLFGLVFLIVSLASWWNSAQTASFAAARGATVVAQSAGAPWAVAAGMNAVERSVGELGGRMGTPPRVLLSARSVTVAVTLEVQSPTSLLPDSVTRTWTVPFEAFVTEADR